MAVKLPEVPVQRWNALMATIAAAAPQASRAGNARVRRSVIGASPSGFTR